MLTPSEITKKAIKIGEDKANLPISKMIILGMFAGAFIALAGVGATFGNIYVGKLAGAAIFPAGLAMLVIAGGELFTGNSLMLMALLHKKITLCRLLKNWILVFLGNFLGALLVVGLVALSGVFAPFAETIVSIAATKTDLSFVSALSRGILCNFLVCIAVWMSFAASSTVGKIAAVFFPIMLFVICGFEHSVANMYYIPAGIIEGLSAGLPVPTIVNFLFGNLLPVVIGNIIGGAGLVATGYYLANSKHVH